jgi:hypothetical protein
MLGALTGPVLAFFLWLPVAFTSEVSPPLGSLALACAVAGTAIGAVLPNIAASAFEGLVHFLVGIVSCQLEQNLSSSHDHGWLTAIFWVGFVYALIVTIWMWAVYWP